MAIASQYGELKNAVTYSKEYIAVMKSLGSNTKSSLDEIGTAFGTLSTKEQEQMGKMIGLSEAQMQYVQASDSLTASKMQQIIASSELSAAQVEEVIASSSVSTAKGIETLSSEQLKNVKEQLVAAGMSESAAADLVTAAENRESAAKALDTSETTKNAAAEISGAAATNTATGATEINTAATIKNASAVGVLKSAWTKLTGVIAAHPIAAAFVGAVAAFAIISNIVDALTTTTAEYDDMISEINDDIKSNEDTISKYNDELETNKQRIEELQNMGTLTYTEEAELEKLKSANRELKEQKKLLEETNKEKYEELALTESDKQNDRISGLGIDELNEKNIKKSQEKFKKEKAHKVSNITDYADDEDDIENLLVAYDAAKKKSEELEKQKSSHGIAESKRKEKLKEVNEALSLSEENLEENYESILSSLANMSPAYEAIIEKQSKNKNVGLTDDEKEIQTTYENLKKTKDLISKTLDPSGFRAMKMDELFDTKGLEKTKKELLDLYKAGELGGNNKEFEAKIKQYPKLAAAIKECGFETKDLRTELQAMSDNPVSFLNLNEEQIEGLGQAFTKAKEKVEGFKTALNESYSGTGLSTDSIDNIEAMYSNLDGYDAAALFENTANGVHLNERALKELNKQYEAKNKLKFQSQLADEAQQYAELTEKIANCNDEKKKEELQSQLNTLEGQIQQTQQLAAQYDGLTSSYQKWIDAQSGGEEGDMYDTIHGGIKSVTELWNKGLVGTNEFEKGLELLSGKTDIASMSAKELEATYNRAMSQTKRYFTESSDGCQRFLEDVNKLNSDWASMNKDGSWNINFDDQALADQLGISVESIQSIMRKLTDYGFDINLDPANASIEQLNSIVDDSTKKLKALGAEPIEINTDVAKLEDIDAEIENAKTRIDQVNASVVSPEVKTEQIKAAQAEIAILIDKKIQAAQPTFMTVDATQLESELSNAIVKLQEYQNSVNVLNGLQLKKEVGIEIDDSQIAEATEKVKSYGEAVNGLSEETKISLGINEIDFSAVDTQTIQNQLGEVAIKAKVTPEEVTSMLGKIKTDIEGQFTDASVKVKVNVDGSNEINSLQKDISGIKGKDVLVKASAVGKNLVNTLKTAINSVKGKETKVKATTSGKDKVDNLKTSIGKVKSKDASVKATTSGKSDVDSLATAIGKVKSKTVNVTVNNISNGRTSSTGTAFFTGTAFANGSGNWGVKNNQTALVGELAPELVVSNGQYRLVGAEGAEFANLKKNDIVFNASQTAAILKYGGLKGANSRGKVFGNGSAYSDGNAYSSGSGAFKKKTTTSSKSSSSSKTSSSSSSSSKTSSSSSSKAASETAEAAEEFLETVDWIEVALDRIATRVKRISDDASNGFVSWRGRTTALSQELSVVGEQLNLNKNAYDQYMNKANSVGLSEDYKVKVQNGTLSIEDIRDENTKKLIDDYKNWYDKAEDVKDTVIELQTRMSELAKTNFDNISKEFEGILSLTENTAKRVETYMNTATASGYLANTEYYKTLQEIETSNLDLLRNEKKALQESLQNALNKGAIQMYSEEWYNLQGNIDNVDQSILDATKSIIEFQNEINQTNWDNFDYLQDTISEITTEAEFLANLIKDKKLFDEFGNMTGEGMALQGLHGIEYNTYMRQADDYAESIRNLDEEFKDDSLNTNYLKRRQELIKLQQDSIKNAEDEKKAMIDLVKEGYDIQLDYLKQLIDARKDLLKNEKDQYSYEKKVKEQTKNVSDLEKQLNAYAGDDSEGSRKTVQGLKTDLQVAKDNLEETQYDKYISDQEALLDAFYSNYEEWINARLDDQEAILNAVIDEINLNAGSIAETITNSASDVGYTLSESFNSILSEQMGADGSICKMLSMYNDNFSTKMTSLQVTVDNINAYIRTLQKKAEDEAKAKAAAEAARKAQEQAAAEEAKRKQEQAQQQAQQQQQAQAAASSDNIFVYKKDSYPKSKLQRYSSIVDALKYYDYDSSFSQRRNYYEKLGLGSASSYTGSSSQNQKMLQKFRSIKGYSTGGIVGNLKQIIDGNGDDSLSINTLKKGEAILPTDMTKEWKKLIATLPAINALVSNNMGGNNPENVSLYLNLPNVHNYEEFRAQMVTDPKFEKATMSMINSALTGKNSLNKLRYK